MNTKRLFQKNGNAGLALCGALFVTLTGCVGHVEQPRRRAVYVPPPPVYAPAPVVYVEPRPVYAARPVVVVAPPAVEVAFAIRSENDFYEPLTPYGRWEVVGSHGRCWIPGRVEADWRPYSNGYWQRTDAGWYWASDEPWAWATYHYGRWDLSPQFGWYWVPQTQWAPAWVSWHEGGGHIGWAPLQPSVRVVASGVVAVNVALIAPRAFVFVEERRFLEPVRPATVVVNNTTIINNTVNITNVKVVNNTVINEGPRTAVIEQATAKKVQAVPVRELRQKQEAEVVAKHRTKVPALEKAVQAPVRTQAAPVEPKAAAVQPPVRTQAAPIEPKVVPATEPRPAAQPAVTKNEPAAPAPGKRPEERETVQPVPAPAEAKDVVKPETKPVFEPKEAPAREPRVVEKPAVIKHQPVTPAPGKRPVERVRVQPVHPPAEANPKVTPVVPPETKPVVKHGAEHLLKGKQDGNKKQVGTNTVNKGRNKKNEAPQSPPEKPVLPQ